MARKKAEFESVQLEKFQNDYLVNDRIVTLRRWIKYLTSQLRETRHELRQLVRLRRRRY